MCRATFVWSRITKTSPRLASRHEQTAKDIAQADWENSYVTLLWWQKIDPANEQFILLLHATNFDRLPLGVGGWCWGLGFRGSGYGVWIYRFSFFVQLRRVYSPANSRDKSASLSKYYGIYQRKGLALLPLKCTMCRNERFFQLFWNLFLIWSEEFQSSLSMNDDGVGDVDSMTTYYSQYAHTIYTKCYFAFKLQTSSRLCIWMAKRFSLCVLKNCTVGPWRKIDMSQDI